MNGPPACLLLALLGGALLVRPPLTSAGQQVVTLETRPGVTQKVLLLTPEATPHGVLVMFPGGDGTAHFSERDGGVRLSRNFLLRASPLFVGRGFVVAIVDAPSDQATGMSDRFRTGAAHTEDARKVVERLGRHREDACELSRFEDAVRLRTRVTGSPRVDFVEVLGGDPPGPSRARS